MRYLSVCCCAALCFASGDPPRKLCPFDGFGADPKLAEIKGQHAVTAYYGCSETAPCLNQALKPGEPVVVYHESAENGDTWTCGYHSDRSGASPVWVRSSDIRAVPAVDAPGPDAWIGAWRAGPGRITISRAQRSNRLHLSGASAWHGARGNEHLGNFEGEASPAGNHIHFREEGETGCAVDLTLIGKYLITDDNNRCGGMNVRFMGVWTRQ